MIEPLLEIETKAAAWPRSPDEYGGIIITSRHAVPPEARGKTAHMPLYVVGEVVAETARTKGFKNIVTCAPTAQKLYNHMALNRADYTQPLLYLRGADTAFPMAESLQEIGVDCEEAEVYVSHPAQAFSPSTRAALQGGDIGAVTLFSARTARIFTELYVREVNAVRPSLTLLCFSDSVLECVRSLNMEQAYSCAEPTRAAMIKLIRQHIPRTHRPQQGARHMTQTQNNDTLGNAEEIIERFGGIRPMSTKTNIPVTTIQGWKKRGAIPAARLDDLLKAAKSHDVKLE
ncbi:MAG: uroporphyrinogen-III synthase, partial [Alphaproteobacteria bacterium]|nr:uroporphyrinogen-III synthase [Alphaproteobacteria bacterium]